MTWSRGWFVVGVSCNTSSRGLDRHRLTIMSYCGKWFNRMPLTVTVQLDEAGRVSWLFVAGFMSLQHTE